LEGVRVTNCLGLFTEYGVLFEEGKSGDSLPAKADRGKYQTVFVLIVSVKTFVSAIPD
jgi:hypothetical protein